MRAWYIDNGFSINNLKWATAPDEHLEDYGVRVKIHACSLNYRDLMVVRGHYNPNQKLPLIPLSDCAGEVVEVGAKVADFAVGDRVCGLFSQDWCHGPPTDAAGKATLGSPLHGVLSDYRTFLPQGLIQIPDYLSYEEAATLPCAATTAFNALAYQSGIGPSGQVLILGTGGVSLFALQFAQAFGLSALITSSSDEKLAKARTIYDVPSINYQKYPDWHQVVLDMTKGEGVDVVVEVGGAKTLPKSIKATKKGGSVCVIGVLSGVLEPLDLRHILMNQLRIQGVFVGPKTVFAAMNRVLQHQKIKPVIDRVFAFDKAPLAFSYLESQAHFGKVVIKVH